MSSFVVDKREFVKAAGLMYGIEDAKRYKHLWFMQNVRKDFERAYELNVMSVNEQYGDDVKPETTSYDQLFKRYCLIGISFSMSSAFGEGDKDLKSLRPKLMTFFNSVLYQIENPEMHQEVSALFYRCVSKLYEKDSENVEGWWGTIGI